MFYRTAAASMLIDISVRRTQTNLLHHMAHELANMDVQNHPVPSDKSVSISRGKTHSSIMAE